MNSSNYRFTLDLQSNQSQVSIPVILGDTSRAFHISLTDGGIPYTITDGCLAKLSIKRPSGTYLEEFCTIENNTTIKYPFEQNTNTAAEGGLHNCDVTLYGLDGKQIASPRFAMVVSDRVVNRDDINITDEDQTAIDAMIAAEATRAEAERARVIADTERQTALDEAIERVNTLVSLTASKMKEISLLASAWEGEESPYSQVVTIDGVTENSKVDLQPSVEQLSIFHDKDLAFVAENEKGVVTVYAIGDKPANDYNIQVTITEVVTS